MNGHEYEGYVFVDSRVLRTPKEVKFWVGLALEFNARIIGRGA